MPSYVKLLYMGVRVDENDLHTLKHIYVEHDPSDEFFEAKKDENGQSEVFSLPKKVHPNNTPGGVYWVWAKGDQFKYLSKAGKMRNKTSMRIYKLLDRETRMEHLASVFPHFGILGERNRRVMVRAAMTLPAEYQQSVINLLVKP